MNKSQGVIKLCLLMAFISYFIWNQNGNQASEHQMGDPITLIMHQVKNITQKDKGIFFINSKQKDETDSENQLLMINEEAKKIEMYL